MPIKYKRQRQNQSLDDIQQETDSIIEQNNRKFEISILNQRLSDALKQLNLKDEIISSQRDEIERLKQQCHGNKNSILTIRKFL